jgi:NAD(P)H dehydrogenase (quinone)
MDNPNRILILYTSKDGNTARMAELVEEGARLVPDTEVRRLRTGEAALDDLLWADGVACGSPTNMGILSWEMKRWWDEVAIDAWSKIDGKIGCAFSSEGGLGGGAEIACQSMMTVMQNFGMLTFGVTDYVAKAFTLHYGATVARAPRDDRDQDSCRRLGRRLAEFVGCYVHGRQELHPNHADYPRFP